MTTYSNRPHDYLTDGSQLALNRLKENFHGILDDKTIQRLCERTFLQSDLTGRVIVFHDTGNRIKATSAVEVEQSIIGRPLKNGWERNLLATVHPVYAPNKPMWLRDGTVLFRNTWRQSEVSKAVPEWTEEMGPVERPVAWEAFLYRLFYGEFWRDFNDKEADPQERSTKIKTDLPDRLRFMHEFELWLAFSLFSDERPRWSPILRGEHGIGKGTLEAQVIHPFVGTRNYVKVLPYNIKGDHGAQFLTDKCMVVFDEVNDRGSVFYDRLKNITTEDQIAVNPKGLAPYTDDAVFSTLILSNEEAPIGYPQGERRWLVSPYMVHESDADETGAFLRNYFLPWLHGGGYTELGLFLKYVVATNELPSVAWKSPWFFETCKADRSADHETAILSWLDSQNDDYGYTVTGLADFFKAPTKVVRACLESKGYRDGKIKGTSVNVKKRLGTTGELHPVCKKT